MRVRTVANRRARKELKKVVAPWVAWKLYGWYRLTCSHFTCFPYFHFFGIQSMNAVPWDDLLSRLRDSRIENKALYTRSSSVRACACVAFSTRKVEVAFANEINEIN